MKKSGIGNLEIYNEAMEITDKIWNCVDQWTWFQKDTMGKNLVRACDSVVLNISEGYGRFHYKDGRRFCYFARGSLYETLTALELVNKRKLIDASEYDETKKMLIQLLRKLNNYIKSVNKKIMNEAK